MTHPQAVSAAKPRQAVTAAGSPLAAGPPPVPFRAPGAATFSQIEPLAGMSGTEDALAAARAGDSKLADELEVHWLNAWGPRPQLEDLIGDWDHDHEGWAVRAARLLRNAGPRGETLIEWAAGIPCGLCMHKIGERPDCRRCGGRGFLSDDVELYRTDLDLNPVEGD